ncbi:MAG TPA: heavy metal translocating P-type ATPase [Alphaproteobacteria bacterium]|nr:heavy metal translocating P-type ATPase [Alphaproteobacteria bacterium]
MAEIAGSEARAAPALPEPGLADPAPFVRVDDTGIARLHLAVENVHCGGCVRRIERALNAEPGVVSARVNLTMRRLFVQWRAAELPALELIRRLAELGYRAVPFDPEALRNEAASEDRALLRAMAVAGFAAANVMLLSVSVWAGAFSQDMAAVTRDLFHWISALIALPAVVYAGRPFFRSAVTALGAGSMNMDVPISLAVLLASGMSLYETAAGGPHAYFDASVGLLFFLLVGRYLDRRARGKARAAAEQLMLLGGEAATLIEADGSRRAVPVGELRAGMAVFVAPGDRVPVDGTVTGGASSIDTSLVTGESLPRAVAAGMAVHAGTLNLDGPLEVRVAAAGDDTLLAGIVRLMESAMQGRARYVRLADRMAKIYAPTVHIVALATFFGWWLLMGAAWQPALLAAVAVLIVTCPCALGLAVPAVQVVASGRLFQHGVLVTAPDGLERLAQADTLVFDKTGTLTLGRPELADAEAVPAAELRFAASLAAASRHPLCQALVRAAGPVASRGDVREERGMGLAAPDAGGEARLGNAAWCGLEAAADPEGRSELWLTRPGAAPRRFLFDDRLRPDAVETLAALRRRGFRLELLSGDREPAVARIAAALALDDWRAEMRPDAKVAHLQALAVSGRVPAMVGDGLNDAAALAAAHVSLSPSTAADITRTAADFVFQGERLAPLLQTVTVARGARRLILENFGLAMVYNLIAVPLAAAGVVTPLIAAIAMSSSSLVVTLNALRLRHQRLSRLF